MPKSSLLIFFPLWLNIFRWLRPLLKIGLKREPNEDDIYAVSDGMQSAQNTDALAKSWQIELAKKNPSILRAMLRLYGLIALVVPFLYAIVDIAVT